MLVLEPSTAQPLHLLFDTWPGYDQYVTHYAKIDSRNAHGSKLGGGIKVVDYDFTTETEMARSEFYQDYLLRHEMGYVGAEMLVRDSECVAAIAMQRARSQGPYELHELRVLDRLAPHLTRALRLQTRFVALEAQRWADQTVRDRLPFAVILVDERGRIVSQNQAATDLLAAGDGLTARHGCLRTRHPAEQGALDRLIRGAGATADGHGAEGGGALALRRPSMRRALDAFVMPIPRQRNAFSLDIGAPVPAALVIVTDPEAAPPTPAATLRRRFGLTPAEAALAQALAAGRSLHEYAEQAHVTCETARWRLKQVLAKTDTHRQAELVRLLLTSVLFVA
jgi:DNA-binding CsgD family transcriptional regulator